MKEFFKMFFASLLGVIAAGIILLCISLFIMVGWITSMATSITQTETVELRSNSILKIGFDELPEVVTQDPFANLSATATAYSLSDAIEAIRIAKNNPNIKGIYLNTEMPMTGMASLEEVRRALEDFKKSGKFIVSYGDNYSQKGYYLSSVANQVFLNPLGKVNLVGIAASTLFYKRALDKLGVEMLTFKVGTYKGAVEPYTLDHFSDANREQLGLYINGLWDNIVNAIAQSRKVTPESLRLFAERGDALSEGTNFIKQGLVDSLIYREDLEAYLAAKSGLDKDEKPRLVAVPDMLEKAKHKHEGDPIAVVYAEGAIMPQAVNQYKVSAGISEQLTKQLKALAEDKDIKAVVMRVNSPGGSAFLSEQIWHQVKNVKKNKPIVISMGDYAASGGYYISAAANMIFAEPNTLTGSIGIFGQVPNAAKLANKMGIDVDVVKTSPYADMLMATGSQAGLIKPMSNEERALVQMEIERGYDTFLTRVADGRSMTKAGVDSIPQGHVWLGTTAKEIGLVDQIGGMDEAIKAAAKLANLKKYHTVYDRTPQPTILDLILKRNDRDLEVRLLERILGHEEMELIRSYREARQMGIMTRLPYGFSAY